MLEHTSYTIFMTILTVFALFGDDLRVAAFNVHSDDYFYGITTMALLFFTLEVIL